MLAELADLYGTGLGLDIVRVEAGVAVQIGSTLIEFAADDGRPFYHFALHVPGDRFAAAQAWARDRVALLPDPDTGSTTFDFDFWDAQACYFHDAAENIVELIAHRGIGDSGRRGAFSAGELLGLSELGLVGDPRAMAATLAHDAAIEVWSGTVGEPGRLAFAGEQARTLILCPTARPWLPTARPAEAHPVEAVLTGAGAGEAILEGSLHRIRRRPEPEPLRRAPA